MTITDIILKNKKKSIMLNNAWLDGAVKNLIWFCNPFFTFVAIFHTLEEDIDSSEEIEKEFAVIETSFALELNTHSKPKHIKIMEKIQSHFSENFEEELMDALLFPTLEFFDFDYYEGEGLPILNLTYIFSFFIACNKKLRTEFYESYKGKVPAITQFLLNHLRVGYINENTYVSDIQFDPTYFFLMGPSLSEMVDTRFNEFCTSRLLREWFKQLEKYCGDNKLFFHYFVDLQEVPFETKEKLTLTGFNQINPDYLTNANLENLPNKEKHVLVNQAINAFLVEKNHYEKHETSIDHDDSRWLGGGQNQKKWISEDQVENYKSPFRKKLLDFIIYCNPKDF